jgi:hypothetical protein
MMGRTAKKPAIHSDGERLVRHRHNTQFFKLIRTPIEPEILSQVKDEILHLDHLATLQTDDTHTAVLANSTIAICKVDIPVDCDDVGTTHSEYVLDTNLLDVELNFWILFKKLATPFLDSRLASERATGPHFAGIN